MESQADLFGHTQEPGLAHNKGILIIGASKTSRLSKAQQQFNRLVGRIEKIRLRIESTQAQLDEQLAFYAAELHPIEEKIATLRKQFVARLHPFLTHRELRGKNVRKRLKRLIADQLRMILGHFGDLDSPELQAIYQSVEGKSLDESDREHIESTRAQVEDLCEMMGIKVDLSDIKEGISEEALNRKFEELEARLNEAQGQDPAESGAARNRPKTKRQSEREARERAAEELRARDISRLYKQLAKLLHPDLEPDASRRHEKEAAMKRLTTAYKEGDLHTLLRLEVEWIVRAQADAERLTDEKLAIYNSVLKEQVAESEEELRDLSSHPRYLPLRDYTVGFALPEEFDGEQGRQRLVSTLASLEQSVVAIAPDSETAIEDVRRFLEVYAAREERERQLKRMGFDWD